MEWEIILKFIRLVNRGAGHTHAYKMDSNKYAQLPPLELQ